MKILGRYLLRTNLYYISVCLALGVGIYILSDLFDRLDDFVEAGLGFKTIVVYFLVKTPLIISQILPVIFLLSVMVQLSIMGRSRELLALQTGGVPLDKVVLFLVIYGVVWAGVQLGFSQLVGVHGEQEAYRIWKEEVRDQPIDNRIMTDVWFREGPYVVKIDTLYPYREEGEGEGVTVYMLDDQELEWRKIIRAETFRVDDNTWTLYQAEVVDPTDFSFSTQGMMNLPLQHDLQSHTAIEGDPARLPLWRLSLEIERLRASGSNVERLRSAWHMKLAYAFSIPVMALIAMALVTWRDNIYLNVALSMVLAFAYYGGFVVGASAGEKGLVPPFLGAWGANLVFGLLAMARLSWVFRSRA